MLSESQKSPTTNKNSRGHLAARNSAFNLLMSVNGRRSACKAQIAFLTHRSQDFQGVDDKDSAAFFNSFNNPLVALRFGERLKQIHPPN